MSARTEPGPTVLGVFRDLRRFWRVSSKSPRALPSGAPAGDNEVHPAALTRALTRAVSDSPDETPLILSFEAFRSHDTGWFQLTSLDLYDQLLLCFGVVTINPCFVTCYCVPHKISGTFLESERCWTEGELEEGHKQTGVSRSDSTSSSGREEKESEFRARASTDSRLPPRPARSRHPPQRLAHPPQTRRMSVAMRGNNASTY
ncbi:hypothetical protein EVAR_59388_1 [Eumeta japonica]|uniref:Uncharacterized protein n=1 Tax=Eumeta variegata TaxID=151549 RepID=A0A4C1YN20_EUMVA|nr:hypothetical protein EVAR_59388_1 [Eumeta japonica]